MIRALALALSLILALAACGGDDPVVGAVGSTDDASPTPADQPTTAADVASPDPDGATEPSDAPEPGGATEPTTPPEPEGRSLVLTGGGLPPGDYTVVVDTADGQVVSIQQFDGQTFAIDLADAQPEDVGTVSVHGGSTAAGPALLSGELTGGVGTLTATQPVDLSSARGQYILATPTNGGDSDERSGIWYVLIPRAPGLVLPVLPPEWVYEGWVTIDGIHVTSGRFSDPATADDFDGFSGDQGGPPLPGEDFLINAPAGATFPVDLAGLTAFVTIEPAEDSSPEPSGLTVLSGTIPPDAADHTIYDLTSTVDALPTLSAQVV